MIAQGSHLVNSVHFSNLTKSIKAARSCEELQALADEMSESLSALKSGISAELASLQPMLALLQAPGANLAELVNWISNFIKAYLTQMAQPALVYATQLAELELQIATLASAISDAASRFTSCSVSMSGI